MRLDPAKAGFEAPACLPRLGDEPAGGGSFCFDTTLRGNTNGGHLYGTDLPAAEKAALLGYLLTF